MKEQDILKEIRKMLSNEIDNRSTVILIEAKILDYHIAVYGRAFKEAGDMVTEALRPQAIKP